MISRQASHALKALLELAREPQRWRSTRELASVQQLPEPMLEQLLLRLRRGGVLVARRGRLGGYRLAHESSRITVAEVLAGLGEA
ncbi:MAG: Rrf2 family transcriptional regulator, partial [Prochlorococcaceae cyanobacterium]